MATIGCDLASVDENGDPDWRIAEAQGRLRFVGLRVAEGLTPDPCYAAYRRQLDEVRVPNFPYLFLTPGLETPEAQVDVALGAVGSFDQDCFPLAIDVEGSRRGLTAEQWRDWVVRARDRVHAAIGVDPLIYTSHVYWTDPSGMGGLEAPQLSGCLGWWKYWPIPVDASAVYDPNTVDRLAPPPAPPPWGDQWGIHQYQGDAHGYLGFRSTVDLDRLHVVFPGERSDTVRWIQHRLPGVDVDGVFGPKTQAAVRNFQTSKGIAADDVVGLDTMQRLAWIRL